MSRLLLVGVGPLPAPERERVHATGLRLAAFLDVLLGAGHEVALGEFLFSGIEEERPDSGRRGLARHELLSGEVGVASAQISSLCTQIRPDAIVALTDVGALAATRSSFRGPLWIDYFGHPMAERQQQAFAHRNDSALADQWLHVLPALLRGDRFSACSNDQRLALTGELGAAGRLNSATCGADFVAIIPPGLSFTEELRLSNPALLRQAGVPAGARVILSTGGYNTWVDGETLFAGIELALKADPDLHFVSTGGAIGGHVEVVYDKFVERINNSPVRERLHPLGWVPHHELVDAMLLADVAVNCDRPSLEGELGCRNRLFGWLWAGLRVVTTVTSFATREIVDAGHAREVAPGDAEALAAALREEAARGRRTDLNALRPALLERWNPAKLLAPLLAWASNPTVAPDRGGGAVENPLAILQRRFLERAEEIAREEDTLALARELADTLLGSRALRLYGALHPQTLERLKRLRKLGGQR